MTTYTKKLFALCLMLCVAIGSLSADVIKVTTEKDLMELKGPVVVDAYADWCGSCRHMTPIFNELSQEFAGRVSFVKLDVDAASDLADTYDVQSLPTFIFIQDGKVVRRSVGRMGKDSLRSQISQLAGETK